MKSKLLIIIFLATIGFSYWLGHQTAVKPTSSKDPYLAFLQETYDIIKTNYWEKIEDQDLINLYLTTTRTVSQQPQLVEAKDKNHLFKQIQSVISKLDTPEKKEVLVTTMADAVLSNLKPIGRNRLYTQKQSQDLKNTVTNVNPEVNHYQELDLPQGASAEAITKAYQTKKTQTQTEEEKQKLDLAYQALKDTTTRKIYDTTGADPTMPHKSITDKIYYIGIKKLSPTTIQELTAAAASTDNSPYLDTLILDLRDNIGGAIDDLPYFLGPFIGPDQYAYQFLQQGEKQDFKTKTGWINSLVKFKKVVVLINQNTQSSAEVMAAVLKKYHVGILVGTTTRGWGTVEKVYSLEHQISDQQTYSVFLVHHLTLREDGQPIEGQGVNPDVDLSQPNWRQQLNAYFNSPEIINALNSLL